MKHQSFLEKSLVLLLLVFSEYSRSEGNIAMDEEHSQVNNINDPLYDYQGIDLEDKTVVIKSVIDAPYKELPGKQDCPPGYEWYSGVGGANCVQMVTGGVVVSHELVKQLVEDYYRNKTQVEAGKVPLVNSTTATTPKPTVTTSPRHAEIQGRAPQTGNQSTYILPNTNYQPEDPVSNKEADEAGSIPELNGGKSHPPPKETNDPTIVHNYGDTIYDFFSSFYGSSDSDES